IGTGVHTDTTATACGSFTWDRNGETYTESGEYRSEERRVGSEGRITRVLTLSDAIVPVFDAIGQLCLNATAPALPLISTNGITGKWNPATIITTTVGTASYTFTPDEGQCAVDTTIEITVGTGVHTDTTATACGSFTWDRNGETYTESGEYLYTFMNGECEDSITLVLTMSDAVVPVFDAIGPLCLNATA